MVRKFKTDKKIQAIIKKLSYLYTGPKTMLGLSELLSNNCKISTSVFHPNRLMGLLDGNPNRAISNKTCEAIELRLKEIETNQFEDISFQNAIIKKYNSYKTLRISNIFEKLSNEFKCPIGIIEVFCINQEASSLKKPKSKKPDWRWQETAIEKVVVSLKQNNGKKTALIVPTGGGKTRIATQVIFKMLMDKSIKSCLWVAHRQFLLEQALEHFNKSIFHLTSKEKTILREKVDFRMVQSAGEELRNGKKYDLIIIDEAHHAAAPTYQHFFKSNYWFIFDCYT